MEIVISLLMFLGEQKDQRLMQSFLVQRLKQQ